MTKCSSGVSARMPNYVTDGLLGVNFAWVTPRSGESRCSVYLKDVVIDLGLTVEVTDRLLAASDAAGMIRRMME
jgi:hypothetical protein